MSDWEAEQQEYLQRLGDALDAREILLVMVCFALAVAAWHWAVEWFFERLG